MSEFTPVATLADLETIDPDDNLAGYCAGIHGAPLPPEHTITRSWHHGWRNGRVDGGHAEPDDAQQYLAQAYHAAQRRLH